ncbi:hypothetical protein NHX12_028762 [Muraenolepis orangiensis]|uniref:Coiled-coil domain-containing protein 157 n=1 Tax=Muraenolepis orangiensis TaxID=630683 RepID=A0A9Q0EDW9_9TELE|nr:hypothetical protein NHX12_028762 [Muraenolepis orangiensis]
MSRLMGRDRTEGLRSDLVLLQGAVVEVFSRIGPVRRPSWRFPDQLSCHLDLGPLLEWYDPVEGDEEFNQHSHTVLLELVIDRLLLLLQSFDVYTEQLTRGQTGCGHTGSSQSYDGASAPRTAGPAPSPSPSTAGPAPSPSPSTAGPAPSPSPSTAGHAPSPSPSTAGPAPSLSPSTTGPAPSPSPSTTGHAPSPAPPTARHARCQTVESSLVPCDACEQVQGVLRQTADCLVELCQREGLPSALQPLLEAAEDTAAPGQLTAYDLRQWAGEQRRDLGRLGKHLGEVRATLRPLAQRLARAEREREEAGSLVERAQQEAKKEKEKSRAGRRQMERSLEEAQRSVKETERRMQEEQLQLKRSHSTLEDHNSRLKEELAAQHETLTALECENRGLVETVKALQSAEEAHLKLQGRAQLLESQMADTQLRLSQERSKLQSACCQQESMEARHTSSVERTEALEREQEELQSRLGESEERESGFQRQLNRLTEEKKHLLEQSAPQQVLCAELQREKEQLEALVDQLKSSMVRLRGELQDLGHRERLLVAFPQLCSLPQAPPQSTGSVLEDMEQQLHANRLRVGVLERENATLNNSIHKLKLRMYTRDGRGGAERLKHDPLKGADGGRGPESIGRLESGTTSSSSSPPTSPLLLHGHTLQKNAGRPGSSVKHKTYGQMRHASAARRAAANRGNW